MSMTNAQLTFLRAWQEARPSELADAIIELDLGVLSIEELSAHDANTVLAVMTAQYGEPRKGEDSKNLDDKHKGEQGDDDGQGDGYQQHGHGQGEGQGDGDGDGDNNNQQNGDNTMENPYRNGSKEQVIAQALIENDLNAELAFQQIKDKIGNEEPLIFQGNVGGGRAPLPIGSDWDKSSDKTQKGRGKKTINDVRRDLLNGKQNQQGKGQGNQQDDQQNGEQGEGQNGSSGSGGNEQKYEAEILLDNLNEARAICDKMNADGEPFDTVGLRPFVHAPKMLAAGFPRLTILDAMTLTWPKEVRRTLNGGTNLPEYDHRKFPKAKAIESMPLDLIEQRIEPLKAKTQGKSLYLPAMVSLAEINVPILQIGEKGTGKTTNAEHLAEALAEKWDRTMPFGFASMTSGTSPGEFKGRITLDGFLPSLFCEIYENGGVYLFDELDAGDENLLTLLNSALANGYFVDQKGRVIEQHERFVPVAAANTTGLGATARYTGRNRLDAATLDRWAMGRIRVDFDHNLAEYIYWNNLRAAALAA